MDFSGRHVLITGASTGIGRAAAELIAARGGRVSLVARRSGPLEDLAAAITAQGGEALACAADVADGAAQAAAVDAAEARFGPVRALFANAGTGGRFGPLTACEDALFARVLEVNLVSVFRLLKRVLPGMIAARQGSVVVTGSLASERGMPMNAAYVAAKHGLIGLARAAAAEAAPHNVRVNGLLPGFIETPMLLELGDAAALRDRLGGAVPMGRIGSAEEAAQVAAFLLSDAASHITAQSIAVDGGLLGTLIPG